MIAERDVSRGWHDTTADTDLLDSVSPKYGSFIRNGSRYGASEAR